MHTAFSTYHPAVAAAYFACVIVLAMAATHPIYVPLACAGALACSFVCKGVRATVRSLRWALILALAVAAVNPFIVASGSTELFRIGVRAIYAEALVYGLCAGGMLASVLLWFSSYAACMDSERSMALFAGVLPTVSFMLSAVLRLVPQFLSRGAHIYAAQTATSAAAPRGTREKTSARLRQVNVLMAWGMEDGLVRSDCMRARGYGCGARRTSYRRFRFEAGDAVLIFMVVALAAASAGAMAAALPAFNFYPTITPLGWWWGYVPYILLLCVPVALWVRERWLWRKVGA